MTESRFAGFICMSLGIGKSWKQRQSTGMASFACVFVLEPHSHSILDVAASQVTCVDLGFCRSIGA